jgi:2-polyprenyl-6-methoxyphenol hydroxylase-like FAD-dependent oxidoreductase
MAGLAAARALSDCFERVSIVERDTLPKEVARESRKGVPQGNHAHALLASGRQVLDEYFPGISDELTTRGALSADVAGDFLYFQYGHWKLRTDVGVRGLSMSRPLLEAQVRARTKALKNVAFIENHDVEEARFDPERGRVVGVRVKDRATGERGSIDADLVVDALGRGSPSPKWLAAWGFPEVPETIVKCDVGYATGLFPRLPTDLYGTYGAIVIGTPPTALRGGGLFAIEGDLWIVGLGCWLGDYPPTDLPGYREFAKSLPKSEIYDVVKDRDPVGKIAAYRFPSSRYRHFEKLSRFPEGYLVTGDALCSFNPLYGQGMSVALLEAKALGACVAAGERGLAARFFVETARVVAGPWSIAVGEDLRFPTVEGPRPPGTALINRYMEAVHRAAARDPVVLRRFVEVAGLLRPPTSILAPSIALRVFTGGRGAPQPSPAQKVRSSFAASRDTPAATRP